MKSVVLPLGDPRLRVPCEPVASVGERLFKEQADLLVGTLRAFREAHGFGRGIAAPQIGILRRFVAIDLGQGPEVLVNPEISWRSEATFTLWDDCMCFPDLLVRVARHRHVSVAFTDLEGRRVLRERLPQDVSELLQHEFDHLDGILAIDRATGPEPLILRAAFEADPAFFLGQVDHQD